MKLEDSIDSPSTIENEELGLEAVSRDRLTDFERVRADAKVCNEREELLVDRVRRGL